MAEEEVIIERVGNKNNYVGMWFILFVTIVLAVITGILLLDVITKLLPSNSQSGSTGTTG